MSYFFSQPDADDEPTIWLETGESAAVPMLRKVSIGTEATADEDDQRLWSLIEHVVESSRTGTSFVDSGVSYAVGIMPTARERALNIAEAYIAETVPSTAPLNERGYPASGWKPPAAAERLELVLDTARFLLGEDR